MAGAALVAVEDDLQLALVDDVIDGQVGAARVAENVLNAKVCQFIDEDLRANFLVIRGHKASYGF